MRETKGTERQSLGSNCFLSCSPRLFFPPRKENLERVCPKNATSPDQVHRKGHAGLWIPIHLGQLQVPQEKRWRKTGIQGGRGEGSSPGGPWAPGEEQLPCTPAQEVRPDEGYRALPSMGGGDTDVTDPSRTRQPYKSHPPH